MRKICFFLFGLFLCTICVDVLGAVRSQNTVNAQSRQTQKVRDETQTRSVSARTTTKNTTMRQTSARTVSSNKIVTGRNTKTNSVRSATSPSHISRAAATVKTRTFGSNYNSCRDAYFTCMDQFCATQNESYRRCVCSSKLKDIQKQESLLSQTSDSLQDFESLNIEMINKTTNEVKAMLSASDGEAAIKQDTSDSANTLKNISGVLNKSKQESLSTQGKLDVGGDIKAIWTTTNLIGGSDIANLTGEELFNAVHSQCSEMVSEACAGSDLKMVASAYGMYIENDCSLIENNLKAKKTAANAAIRQTRHKMQDTRLENYDAHNSTSMNDCIANVRKDILMETACGPNYVHCLDFTSKYIYPDGTPKYTPEFYQIENQISLSGDVLQNGKNGYFISMLNQKREFAEKDLKLCTDDADDVWDEFMRQALVEIYQQQQARVKTVKGECLKVVNDCYKDKSDKFKDLTDNSDKISLAQTLEVAEDMCAEKLNTCSNLYGGGDEGLSILIATMTAITDATVTQSCYDSLMKYAKKICAVPANDSKHSYPFNCRSYAPGESMYAYNETCNSTRTNPFSRSEIVTTAVFNEGGKDYYNMCLNIDYTKKYTRCKRNHYLWCNDNQAAGAKLVTTDKDISAGTDTTTLDYFCPNNATACKACTGNLVCTGGTAEPYSINKNLYQECGEYYIGSLYQQFAIFALQNCTRPSNTSYSLDESLIAEVDKAIQEVRTSMLQSLSAECKEYGGIWVDIPWIDDNTDGQHDYNGDTLKKDFYDNTGTNILWGYCK